MLHDSQVCQCVGDVVAGVAEVLRETLNGLGAADQGLDGKANKGNLQSTCARTDVSAQMSVPRRKTSHTSQGLNVTEGRPCPLAAACWP